MAAAMECALIQIARRVVVERRVFLEGGIFPRGFAGFVGVDVGT